MRGPPDQSVRAPPDKVKWQIGHMTGEFWPLREASQSRPITGLNPGRGLGEHVGSFRTIFGVSLEFAPQAPAVLR